MTSINSIINNYLDNKKIEKHHYDDLKSIVETIGFNKVVLDWFSYLHSIEVTGWRPKLVTQKISRMLASASDENPIEFFALFCPSYKKGLGLHGFRTDDVGSTSKIGVLNLSKITKETISLGIPCKEPSAIFFDIAIEQPTKTLSEISDLKTNIQNLKKYMHAGMKFSLLSEVFPNLFDTIGYKGIKISPLPIPQKILDRITIRGGKFYEHFGWSKSKIQERSEVIASSEALVGNTIRYEMPNSIMIYTPTMLERAQIYSGMKYESDPLPIIFPKHES